MSFDAFLEELKKLKTPSLVFNRTALTDQKILKKLVFPHTVLVPIGTYNENYEAEVEEFNKNKQGEKPRLVDSKKLHEQLEQNYLNLYTDILPMREDFEVGYGAKFLTTTIKNDGFGMYSVFIETGLSRRKSKGDWRHTEKNDEVEPKEEKIFIVYDFETKKYRRVNSKSYDGYKRERTAFKYTDEAAEFIHAHKMFYLQFSKPSGRYMLDFIKDIKSMDNVRHYRNFLVDLLDHFYLLENFYLYHNIIGTLHGRSHAIIKHDLKEIKELASALKDRIDKTDLKNYLDQTLDQIGYSDDKFYDSFQVLRKMIIRVNKPEYRVNVFENEFYENMMAFYYSQHPTHKYEDNSVHELRKRRTLLEVIDKYYLTPEITTKTNEQGIYPIPLTEEYDVKTLNEKINGVIKKLETYRKNQVIREKRPILQKFDYLLQLSHVEPEKEH